MRSPADPVAAVSRRVMGAAPGRRVVMERVLRGVAIVALGVLLALAFRRAPERPIAVASEAALDSTLASWATTAPARAALALDSAPPSAMARAWARALRASGTTITWHATSLASMAVSTEPLVEPRGGVRIATVGDAKRAVTLRDAAGMIDSLPADSGGALALDVPRTSGSVRVAAGRATALTAARDSVAIRQVVVLGSAGWEGKFVVAALEELGWPVAARLRVSPGATVTQQEPRVLDTATVAAVVVLDSAGASDAAEIERYVRAGGGVVLAGESAMSGRFTALRAGAPGDRAAGIAGGIRTPEPRSGLPLIPIARPVRDAVVLERRAGAVAVAARRVGRGRVLQLGYDESWRWRMTGDDAAPDAHRRWWSRVIATVAYAPALVVATAPGVDEAPVAATYAMLGAPSADRAPVAGRANLAGLEPWLFAIAMLALLGEWASRRVRGAR